MKKLKITVITFISLIAISTSCKKDADDQPGNPSNTSRTLRYEASGNFTGTLIASYTTATGGTANEQITIPFNKEVTYGANVTAAIMALTGSGGVAGQKVTLVIKRGGVQVGTPTEFTAQTNGGFSSTAPVVVF